MKTILISLTLSLIANHTSFAQPLSAAGQEESNRILQQEEIRRRTQQEAEERRKVEQSKDTFLQKKLNLMEETTLPVEEISFMIHTLQLEGEKSDQFPWIQEMLRKYKGQKIGKEGLSLIVKRLTNQLIIRGYTTTRIGIPEQDLASGILKINIIPGIIRDIRIITPNCRANWHTAFPTHHGKILNLRDLEQGLEQIKRVPSQDADMKITPGDKPGESDVLITVTSTTPIRTSLSLDDSGMKATGKLQSSISLSVDNIVGINDLFYVSFNKDAEQQEDMYGTHGNSYQYSMPYGYWTFSLSGNSYDYHQTIQGRNQRFSYSGKSESNEFSIQRLIHRDQQSKTSLQFKIIKKNSQSFINDEEIETQHKNVTADELSISHRKYYGKKILDLTLAHRWGVPWFNAQNAPEQSDFNAQTTRYKLWTLDAMLTMPVQFGKIEGKYSCKFHGQYTPDLLQNGDYFSIGNRYTVRGFDGEQNLSAEKGWFVRNEWSIPSAKQQEIYIGLDYGEVSGWATQWLLGNKLAGAALGVRGNYGNAYYDVFTSCPIYKPKGYSTSPYCFGFQLTYQL